MKNNIKSIVVIIVALLVAILANEAYAQRKVTRSNSNSVRSSKPSGFINGHGYVDLGLPSGLKWATCNVGASSPEEFGNYYAWGETRTKAEYIEDNSLTIDKTSSALRSAGIINSNNVLTKSHDAARSNWGSTWRMPTKAEMEELVNKCRWTWTTKGGKTGYKVTGPNGKSIFLPAAGSRYGSSIGDAGEYGGCWSSSAYDGKGGAYYLVFNSLQYVDWNRRIYGFPVRPVSSAKEAYAQGDVTKPNSNSVRPSKSSGVINGHGYVDLGLPSGLKWATCNVGASSPEEFGNYYAWGETRTKTNFTEITSQTYFKTSSALRSAGIINSNNVLTKSHDAARSNWGSTWRMPTKAEMEELQNKCTWTWTTQGGKKGYKVTGPNGKSIFLPAAGDRNGSSFYHVGQFGFYWSSSAYDDSYYAYGYGFNSDVCLGDRVGRGNGFSVRPVSE